MPICSSGLDVLVQGGICEFLNLAEEFFILRALLLRIIQILEQAGEAHKIVANGRFILELILVIS